MFTPKNSYLSKLVLAMALLVWLVPSFSFAQDTYRPLKAGNAAFSEAQMKPEVKDWYRRFWAAALRSAPGEELDPATLAKSGDNFKMGRPFDIHMTALLMAYRLTGDLKVLDEIDRLMQLARAQLRDAWDNGQTDGFLSWRDYVQTPIADQGKDITRPIDEYMYSGMIAEVAWAFRLNQSVKSPTGVNYKERADFWQNYLSNHWEKKIRRREGKNATQFPFGKKAINHVFVAFAKYHYYMSKLTGRTDYMNECDRMLATLRKNMCEVQGPNGPLWMWPHMVYYDITSSDSFSGPNDTTAPPMTTYIRHSMSTVISMHMEGIGFYKDHSTMRMMIAPMRDFMLDGGDPLVARSLGGEVTRTGILNGVTRKLVPIAGPPQTNYGRANEYNWTSSAQMLAAIWDSTGKMHRVNEDAYGVTQYWWAESPRTVFSSLAMMWYAHAKSSATRPYVPSQLAGKAISHNQIDLTWSDNSTNETGFRVERSLSRDSGFSLIATLPANTTKYSNTGLKMGTKYYYKVTSFNSYGSSPFYGLSVDVTTKKAPPAAPSNLTAQSASTSSIKLAWSDNSDNETGFNLEKRRDGQTAWSGLATVGANVTSYTHTGQTKGVKYYYRVRAKNSIGNSVFAPEASAIVGQTPPAAPSSLVATNLSSSQIRLIWRDNSSSETNFRILRSTNNLAYVEIAKLAANTTNYISGNLAAGTKYYYKVRGQDAGGDSNYSNVASATTSGTGTPPLPNQNPSVSLSLGASGPFTAPATVLLNASASDSDGTITKVEFLNGSTVIGSDTSAPYSFSWSNVASGSYTITARATDNLGATATSTSLNVLVAAPNTPPTVALTSPSTNITLVAPAIVTLAATASDADGSVSKVEFRNGTTVIASDSSSPYGFAWTNVLAGTYSITARATDNSGAITTTSARTVTVNPPANILPSVTLTSPSTNITMVAPATIALAATAADTDGTISKVEFLNGAQAIATDSTSPYSFSWNNVAAGTYSITARATDNAGGTKTSTATTVTVQEPPNVPPTASITSPVAGATFIAPATVVIQANLADSDGTIVKTEFLNGTNVYSTRSGAVSSMTWANLNPGSLSITVRVTDNDGAVTTSKPVSVTIAPPPNVPPTIVLTSPSNGAVLTAPASINLAADAADSDGSVSKVEFLNGSTIIGTDTSAPYAFSWSNVAAGTYTLAARATDNSGAVTTSAIRTVTVNPPPNVPPTVSLTSPANGSTFTEPASISIAASASDLDGSVTKVEFLNGSTVIGSDTTAPYNFNWTGVAAGTYTLSARATDNSGEVITSASRTVTVNPPPNQLPVVSLTSPLTGATFIAPASISLVATAADSDGTIAKVDFLNGSSLLKSDPGAPYSFSWTNVPAGTYTFTARAADNEGGIATSSPVTITVNPPPNVAPTITLDAPTQGSSFVAPASIAFTASAADSDGTVSKVEFLNGTTIVGTDTTAPYSFNWTGISAGTYSLSARATDNGGAVTTSSVVSVTVNPPPNQPPVVSLTAPPNGTLYSAPAIVQINATASDLDGTVTKVEFLNGSTVIGSDSTAPYSFTWNNVSAGSYEISARAIDNSNASTISASRSITVIPPPNVPPVITLDTPLQGSSFTAPANILLSATASDSDGSVTKVDFYNGSTLLATDTTAPYSFTWTNVPVGNYSVTARVTDNSSQSVSTAPVSVSVNPVQNQVPSVALTSPANGASFSAPATISLGATASDSDGSITKVEFLNGSTVIATDTSAPYSFSWSNVPAGSYSLAARATDNSGAVITSASRTVTVNPPPNVPPTVALTGPANGATFIAPGSISVTATASDSDGSIMKVEFLNGTTVIGSDTTAPYSFNWTGVTTGIYTLSARATDNSGEVVTSASRTVTVNAPPNQPPTVALTAPADGATFTAPAGFSLTATAADADGSITKVEFLNGSTVIGSDTSAPYSFNWTGVAAGTYTVSARATDNSGEVITSASRTVTVNPPPNQLPTVSLTSPLIGATFTAPASISLVATAADSDGTITKVDFLNGSSLLKSDPGAPYTFSWTNVPAGTYTLTARATDNEGGVTVTSPVTVTVNPPPNVPPTVSLTSPANGSTFTGPASISMTASASDADGSVTKVEFLNGSTVIGSSTSAPYSFNWTGVAQGTYTLTARATDNSEAVVSSSSITVTVNPPPNQMPTVSLTSPLNGATFTAPASISLVASAADADGTITKVELMNGSTVLKSDPGAPYTFNWTNVPAGTYTLSARATDNAGGVTVSSAVNVTVNPPPNVPPTITLDTPVQGSSLTAPATLSFSATASDTDGTITQVEFLSGGTVVGSDNTAPYTFDLTGVVQGTYTLTARATDNSGATADSNAITVTVNAPANQLPTVSLTSPSNGTSFTAPATISLAATASDPDGSITKVEFRRGTTVVNTDTTAPYSFNLTNVAAGTYTFTARAFDNSGGVRTSASVTVTVNAPNQPPAVVLVSPVSGSAFLASGNVLFAANASDSDGSISTVEFFLNGTLVATDSSAPFEFTTTGLAAGSYTAKARAVDNQGAAAESATTDFIVAERIALLVTRFAPGSAETAMKQRLEGLGFGVAMVADANLTAADIANKSLIVVSSNSADAQIGSLLKNAAVPVLCWESHLFDDLGMTGTALETDFGRVSGERTIVMSGTTHPMAANLKGVRMIYTASGNQSWGRPGAEAVTVAVLSGDATKPVIFGYETGSNMTSTVAPARRVGFYLGSDAVSILSMEGWMLFDAAVKWSAGQL